MLINGVRRLASRQYRLLAALLVIGGLALGALLAQSMVGPRTTTIRLLDSTKAQSRGEPLSPPAAVDNNTQESATCAKEDAAEKANEKQENDAEKAQQEQEDKSEPADKSDTAESAAEQQQDAAEKAADKQQEATEKSTEKSEDQAGHAGCDEGHRGAHQHQHKQHPKHAGGKDAKEDRD